MPFSGDKLPVVVGRFIPEGVVMRDPRKNVSVVMFLKCCICIASAISVNINPYAGRVALDICMYGMCMFVRGTVDNWRGIKFQRKHF